MLQTKEKRKMWYQIKIEALEEELGNVKNNSNVNGSSNFDIDSYVKGFYECMRKYGIMTKTSQRIVCKMIKDRYKGDNDTGYVRKVRQ